LGQDVQARLLDASDIGMILESEAFDYPPTRARTEAYFAARNHLIVGAILARKLIGFASGTMLFHPDKPPALFINEVAVDEQRQRQGIGRRLCVLLMEEARARGCEGIWLATEADNVPACALYRAVGGRETGDIVVYDWDGAMDPIDEG
jgi:ribosomal protein S18 acetylase RimI-like enzyme